MIDALQAASRDAIHELRRHELDHPIRGGPGWKVFLETAEDMRRIVRYVEQNPTKIGRPRQAWEFVRAYDGWLPGQVRLGPRAKPQAKPDPRRRRDETPAVRHAAAASESDVATTSGSEPTMRRSAFGLPNFAAGARPREYVAFGADRRTTRRNTCGASATAL